MEGSSVGLVKLVLIFGGIFLFLHLQLRSVRRPSESKQTPAPDARAAEGAPSEERAG